MTLPLVEVTVDRDQLAEMAGTLVGRHRAAFVAEVEAIVARFGAELRDCHRKHEAACRDNAVPFPEVRR